MFVKMDILKLTQAAGFLLKKHNGFITRRRLLKLLYIADRELLQQTRRPLTGDRPVAMEYGPVLSHTYDLLKGAATGAGVWNAHIQQVAPYTHRLAADPGVGRMSKLELAKLEELANRYWLIDDDELSLLTHDFAEWKRNEPPKGGANPIRPEHVLEALGMAQLGDELQADARADAELDALLEGPVS